MNRRDFLKRCALWAAAAPAASWLGGCGVEPYDVGLYHDLEVNFEGSVLVMDYLEGSATFGAVLPVHVGEGRWDRIRLAEAVQNQAPSVGGKPVRDLRADAGGGAGHQGGFGQAFGHDARFAISIRFSSGS